MTDHAALLALVRPELSIPTPEEAQERAVAKCKPVKVSPSPRELECLELLAAGKSVEEIAIILNVSSHTANWYLRHLCLRWDVTRQPQLVAEGFRRGYLK